MSEQVICVDDSLPRTGFWSGDLLKKGEIYTIRRQFMNPYNGEDSIHLFEISTKSVHPNGMERGYLAGRFVPIKDENLEIFRAMDRKIFKKKRVTA